MPKSLWDIAIEQTREEEAAGKNNSNESSVIVVGSKKSGKSNLINRYLSKNETPKPTIALEYVFARHSRGLDSAKDVCHIWELGGGTHFTNLLDVVVTPQTVLNCRVIIVVDLSQPEEIWNTIEALVIAVKSKIKLAISSSEAVDHNVNDTLTSSTKERIGEELMERDPVLVPMVIFGSKYDAFQDYDSEKKKIISKGLRFLALTNGASLYYTSVKSESLINRTKGIFSNLAFDLQSSKTFAVDHNKPLCVPFGMDSIHKIGMSSADDGNNFMKSYDMWKNTFTSTFPSTSKFTMPDDPAKDPNFAERDVDIMRQQKDKELDAYIKAKEKNNYSSHI